MGAKKTKKAPTSTRDVRRSVPYRTNLTLDALKEALGSNVVMLVEYKSKKRIDSEIDDGVSRIVKRHPYGSGYDFVGQVRDVSFEMGSKQALGAARRIKEAYPRVKVRFL